MRLTSADEGFRLPPQAIPTTCLNDGNVFCNAIGIPRGDGFVGIGALSDSNGVRFTREVAAS